MTVSMTATDPRGDQQIVYGGFTLTIKPPRPNYDHRDLFHDSRYVGFVPLDTEDVYLVRCPFCGRENWAIAVADGRCAFCGWPDVSPATPDPEEAPDAGRTSG